MADKALKNTVLKVVNNQLRMNDPKCTRITFERLVASGYSEKEAKDMIGAVLLEDIFYILKDKRNFNEAKYAKKLNSLPGKNETEGIVKVSPDALETDIHTLLQQIEYNTGSFPREILLQIIQRKDEAVPALIELLEEVRDNPGKYGNEGNYFGCIYAACLLAQFRAEEAFPILVEVLSLPGEMPFDLFGDAVCEYTGRILASICGGNISPIKDLIENSEINEYVRGQAAEALAILVLQDDLQRDVVIGYYRNLLNETIKVENPFVMAHIVLACDKIFPGELYGDIKSAFEKDLVDESFIGMKSVDFTMTLGKDHVLSSSRNDARLQYINDTIHELEHWACFHKDKGYPEQKAFPERASVQRSISSTQTIIKDFKVGRNDPCPCGSGKKYKKCCGK